MTGIESARALLREIGPRWADDIEGHRDRVVRTFTPLLADRALPSLAIARDIAYGPHQRQRLDLYRGGAAREPGARCPIMAFVHGGAFVRGRKDSSEQVYGNVPRLFARHGFVGVNIEYRLAPEAPFPAGPQDLTLAVDWLREHAAGFGGDPRRIVLVGHSAGGAHVASYLCDRRLRPAEPRVAGAVLISARLRADVRPDNPNAAAVRAYFGEDERLYEQDSAVSHAQHLNVPALLAVAEHENPWLDVYAAEFCHRAGLALGRIPPLICLPDHNHTSIVAHLDSGLDPAFGEALIAFASGLKPCPS
ncbi:alpha/beta hydrolase [Pelomonas sp. KK5]|uniref:alpha/beta hydrolase n=1 Tax=Pelomonas sp. KK5 TaxID=1855730 RepID=UPI00097C40B4|nr:alpha/beta hydrolase [Pelomonas sp. KK5]